MNPEAPYPVQYSVDYPDRPLNRLTTFFRLFMVIPIAIVVALIEAGGYAYGGGRPAGAIGAAGLVVLPTLLLIVFRQKYPRWWFDWNLELMRFSARIGVYLTLMEDRYPSTDEHQAVHLDFPYPDARSDLNRWLPLVKWLLRHPALRGAVLPLHRRLLCRDRRMVRDPVHRSLPARDVRLPRRRRPLDQQGDRVRPRAGHRPLPAVPPRPVGCADE